MGMIRPFLLLVSAGPALRNQIANMLDYCMIKKVFFGDSHEEAGNIIEHTTKGWQDLCHGINTTIYNRLQKKQRKTCFSWYEILHLVSTSAFKTVGMKKLNSKEAREISTLPKHSAVIRQMENEIIRLIAREYLAKATKFQQTTIKDWWDNRHQYPNVIDNLKAGGIIDEDSLKYALTVHVAALELQSKSQSSVIDMKLEIGISLVCKVIALSISAHIALVIGLVWTCYDVLEYCFGKTEMVVVSPMIYVLNQRILLDAAGIYLEQYLPQVPDDLFKKDKKDKDKNTIQLNNLSFIFFSLVNFYSIFHFFAT